MGAMRNLNLSFGMVNFNVGVHKATESRKGISCKRLHKHGDGIYSETGTRIYCKDDSCQAHKGGLEAKDTISGYEYSKGKFVEVSDAEKDSLKVEGSGMIQVDTVVPLSLLQDRMELVSDYYYLTPSHNDRTPPEAFAVMLEALKRKKRVAIGHTVLSDRTVPVAILPGEDCFRMFTLRFKEELRSAPVAQLPSANNNYVKMAISVLDQFEGDNITLDYADEYRAGWNAMIDAKLKGVKPEETPAPPPTLKSASVEDMFKSALAALESGKKPARKKKTA